MHQPAILISALKYSPVHGTLCHAYGEHLRSEGWHVKYLFSKSLAWTLPDTHSEDIVYFGSSRNPAEIAWDTGRMAIWKRSELVRMINELKPALIFFESSHPGNGIIASLARSIKPDVRIWLLFHEPYVHEKSDHGKIRSLIISGHEWWARRLVPKLDGIIVASDEAHKQLWSGYPEFKGKILKVPLLFEDRCQDRSAERLYFTFVGHAVPAKGIDRFIEIVNRASEQQKDYLFQIVTSTNISGYLRNISTRARASLKVINKPKLFDQEIDKAISQSWAVLAPYKRVTQSAVVPVAYMNGTPVISTRIGGMPEIVIPGSTGFLVEENASLSDWYAAFEAVRSNFAKLGSNCREYFLAHFDARLAPQLLRPMLETIVLGG